MAIALPALAATADLGPFPSSDFVVTPGAAADGAIPQARWYFRDQTVAVPAPGRRVAGFARGVSVDEDLRSWAARHDPEAPPDRPSLVWIASPEVVTHATLDAEAGVLATPEGALPFRLVPKIPLNRSYFDASSAAYFRARPVKARGTFDGGTFVARTLWPEEVRLDALPPLRPLRAGTAPAVALRERMRADPRGGAQTPFTAETLWRRPGISGDLLGRSVVAFMVNGAQGDDDEAHAGHFAIVTGRVQPDGAIGDWLANNFYTLDAESEKGILAAPVPLDDYLADLNAGQGWYRPSYLVVALLARPRAPALLQSGLARVYNQFWRHQLVYYHPSRNCTSISVDALRALGFPISARAATPRPLAGLALPWLVLRERSLPKAMLACDYAVEDPARLLPAAALEEITTRLFALAGGAAAEGVLAAMIAADLDALVYLQIPQLPSSRAVGDAPVVSLHEYRARLPRHPGDYKIVPVPPRPFPASLRDPDLLPPPVSTSEIFLTFWLVLSVFGIPWALARWWRRARRARGGVPS
ncbi:MAG TPA: hypothetical protein VET86_08180 [Casimicrobiaceae bacterium]|nr:hypothetical protein [Casimicrobiaceae bacterium]